MEDFCVDDWDIMFVVVRTEMKNIFKGDAGELTGGYGGEGCHYFKMAVAIFVSRNVSDWKNIVSFRSYFMEDLIHEYIAFTL